MKEYKNIGLLCKVIIIVFSLCFLGGCASISNRIVDFRPLDDSSFGAVSQPAQITKESNENLYAKGYASIGLISVDQLVERCDISASEQEKCQKIPQQVNPTTDLLQESAKRGGEFVTLTTGEIRQEKATAGKRCKSMSTNREYSSMVYYKGQYSPGTITSTQCTAWEKTLSREIHLISGGIIWRLDSQLAKSQQERDKLTRAAFMGDLEGVRKIVEKGVPANSRDSIGIPILGWAAEMGHQSIVEYLLAKGAKLDSNDFLTSPLNMASEAGKEEIVRFLLKKGAHHDARDKGGSTPLFNAAFKGHTGVVRILLNAGADPNAKNNLGNTPLFAAIIGHSEEKPKIEVGGDLFVQDQEIVRLLLVSGADPKAINKANQTPAILAEMMTPASAAARFFVGYWYGATGYIDQTGKWVIRPQFRETGHFHEGLAMVTLKGQVGEARLLYGFIDRTGKIVIPIRFDYVGPFSQGLAAARYGDKMGYIDKSGNWAIEPKYKSAYEFVDGLAAVKTSENHWIFINKQGKQALSATYSDASSFSDGVARVKLQDQSGIIDKTGKWILKESPDCPIPYHFYEGLGVVRLKDGLYGFIDKACKMVIPPSFSKASDFEEGLAAVVVEDKSLVPLTKYIDRSGKIVLGEGWTLAGSFSGGRAMVMNMWGSLTTHLGKREVKYIDKAGRPLLALDYLSDPEWKWGESVYGDYYTEEKRAVFAGAFSEGLAQVRVLGDKFLSLWEKQE
jgi:hypothetical protein